jgi:hypothetical protein
MVKHIIHIGYETLHGPHVEVLRDKKITNILANLNLSARILRLSIVIRSSQGYFQITIGILPKLLDIIQEELAKISFEENDVFESEGLLNPTTRIGSKIYEK